MGHRAWCRRSKVRSAALVSTAGRLVDGGEPDNIRGQRLVRCEETELEEEIS
jgi:hypothetical protein